mmetsp:Transcript_5581/g.12146  ORF Transcript_5581/g.12146 Transcript_5581/m.12146 type:complete len:253 (-) Transcript_5581:414-1172(-)
MQLHVALSERSSHHEKVSASSDWLRQKGEAAQRKPSDPIVPADSLFGLLAASTRFMDAFALTAAPVSAYICKTLNIIPFGISLIATGEHCALCRRVSWIRCCHRYLARVLQIFCNACAHCNRRMLPFPFIANVCRGGGKTRRLALTLSAASSSHRRRLSREVCVPHCFPPLRHRSSEREGLLRSRRRAVASRHRARLGRSAHIHLRPLTRQRGRGIPRCEACTPRWARTHLSAHFLFSDAAGRGDRARAQAL